MIKHSIEINRPAEEVFAYVDQVDRHHEWQEQLVSTTIETTSKAGSMLGKAEFRKRRPPTGRVGIWKLPPLHPPELSSPARKPTSASLAHCATRKGCTSCCFVC